MSLLASSRVAENVNTGDIHLKSHRFDLGVLCGCRKVGVSFKTVQQFLLGCRKHVTEQSDGSWGKTAIGESQSITSPST
ncbi:hypothetical protein PoB_006905300 [Plakobranchus ocellatus]|uniref:Uncharacterized protein n=1 Tax=Plakobranchus ocellatus TaxID=259542 RepID=A0AAV4DER3_9GAST|nr:hypothetical protein PoB_006905300 [Plakobranchus ocellatus]